MAGYEGMGLKFTSNTKGGFHFGCKNTINMLVNDGENLKTIVIRIGAIQPNWIK